MTIDEAIKILTLMGTPDFQGHTEDILTARQLGIEALKFTKNLRDTAYITKLHLLPGETPTINTKRSLHHIKEVQESPLGREPRH